MTSLKAGPDKDLLNAVAVEMWLRANAFSDLPPIEFRRVSTGHSNEMFELRGDGVHLMLRRPPRVTADPSASNMRREHRVLRALDQTDVPHARAVAFCDDLFVTGVPFIVIEWVDGFVGKLPLPDAFGADPAACRDLAFSLVDALAGLSHVDWRAVGLEGFGKPDGFLERQVGRWLGQLDRYRFRDLPRLEEVARWLSDNIPVSAPVGLMHGDFSAANTLFAPELPGRIAAIVDWEQSTIGNPLLDLGWLTAGWHQAGDDVESRGPNVHFSELDGMPSRAEVVERYAQASSLPVDDIRYYQVLATFKLLCILEGSYYRFVNGLSTDPYHASFETRVPALIVRALDIEAPRVW